MSSFKSQSETHRIRASKLSLDEVRRVVFELIEINGVARKAELDYWDSLANSSVTQQPKLPSKETDSVAEGPANPPPEQKILDDEKALVRQHMEVTVSVWGDKGEYSSIVPYAVEQVLNKNQLPARIKQIQIDNWNKYQALAKKKPMHQFTVILDFSSTPVFDFSMNVSNATGNSSSINVFGINDIWVKGALAKTAQLVERRTLSLSGFLHRKNVYDFFLWVLIVPALLANFHMIDGRLTGFLKSTGSGLNTIIYLALFLYALILYKIVFTYARWLLPYLELEEQPYARQALQRGILGTLAVGALGWLVSTVALIVWGWITTHA